MNKEEQPIFSSLRKIKIKILKIHTAHIQHTHALHMSPNCILDIIISQVSCVSKERI